MDHSGKCYASFELELVAQITSMTFYLYLNRIPFVFFRKLSLDQPRLFQDSSFALETFLFGHENDRLVVQQSSMFIQIKLMKNEI